MFAHTGPARFQIQSAEPGHEEEPIGDVVLHVKRDGTRIWYCRDHEGTPLLVRRGRINAFPDAFEAADWLVRWYNRELDEATLRRGVDVRGILAN